MNKKLYETNISMNNRLSLKINHQIFIIDSIDDEDDNFLEKKKNAEWVQKQLKIAVDRLINNAIMATGLKDKCGKEILIGNIVHWSDGGDDLPLQERIKTRWDRIAVVQAKPGLSFKVIDSPHNDVKNGGYAFNYRSFIYTDTENHLTVVADSVEDYNAKFTSAGQCMEYVLKITKKRKG